MDICEQKERNLSFGSADVSGEGTRDELVRTSAREAFGHTALNKILCIPIVIHLSNNVPEMPEKAPRR